MTPAKDIMTTDVLTVKAETPIYDAVNLIVEKRVSGLPVVDDEGNLISVITEKDLLNLLVEGNQKSKVGDFMTQAEIQSFDENDNVVLICEFFIENNIRRVPITKDGKKLVGVISRGDLVRLIRDVKRAMEK